MNLNIINQREVQILARKEYDIEATFDGMTPKKDDIRTAAAKLLKAEEKLVIVKRIAQDFGKKSARLKIYVYSSERDMGSIEEIQKYKVIKARRDEELKKHREGKAGKEGTVEAAKEAKQAEEKPAGKDDKNEVKGESKHGKEEKAQE